MKLLLMILCLILVLAISEAGILRIRVRITFKKKRELEQQLDKQFPDLRDDLLGEADERRDLRGLSEKQKLEIGTGIGESIGKYFEDHQDLLENKDS